MGLSTHCCAVMLCAVFILCHLLDIHLLFWEFRLLRLLLPPVLRRDRLKGTTWYNAKSLTLISSVVCVRLMRTGTSASEDHTVAKTERMGQRTAVSPSQQSRPNILYAWPHCRGGQTATRRGRTVAFRENGGHSGCR